MIVIYGTLYNYITFDNFVKLKEVYTPIEILRLYFIYDKYLESNNIIQVYLNRKTFNENRLLFDLLLETSDMPDFKLPNVPQDKIDEYLSHNFTNVYVDLYFIKRVKNITSPIVDAITEKLVPSNQSHYNELYCQKLLEEKHIRPYDPNGYRPVMTMDNKIRYNTKHPDNVIL